MEEGVRFELTELLHSTVFKTVAIIHSANLPNKRREKYVAGTLGVEPKLTESEAVVLTSYTKFL